MFRFTIRDVLWLTVVVALAVGWWIDHKESAHAKEIVQRWREFGFDVEAATPGQHH